MFTQVTALNDKTFDTKCDHMAMMFIYVAILYIASYSYVHLVISGM